MNAVAPICLAANHLVSWTGRRGAPNSSAACCRHPKSAPGALVRSLAETPTHTALSAGRRPCLGLPAALYRIGWRCFHKEVCERSNWGVSPSAPLPASLLRIQQLESGIYRAAVSRPSYVQSQLPLTPDSARPACRSAAPLDLRRPVMTKRRRGREGGQAQDSTTAV